MGIHVHTLINPTNVALPINTRTSTLRAVTLGNCSLPDGTLRGLHFPLLKQLGLEEVGISECLLQSLIDGCPKLTLLHSLC
jgi:hypothetical protein